MQCAFVAVFCSNDVSVMQHFQDVTTYLAWPWTVFSSNTTI